MLKRDLLCVSTPIGAWLVGKTNFCQLEIMCVLRASKIRFGVLMQVLYKLPIIPEQPLNNPRATRTVPT
jgi:hypothetical protein